MLPRNKPTTAILVAVLTAIILAVPTTLLAQASFTFTYLDGPGEGFNDLGPPDAASTAGGNGGATLGEQRRIALEYAATIWGNLLSSSQTIVIGVNLDPLFCDATSATLGAAGTTTIHRDFLGALVSNTWYPAALANALAGADLAPGFNDIGATFNSAIDGGLCTFPRTWYYGLDENPPPGTIDFVSIVLHELAHGLGFQTYVDLITGARLPDSSRAYDDVFMLWLEDHTTGLTYPDMNDPARVAASINTGNLHWVGPEVVANSGGLNSGRHPSGHVEMYAPNPLDPGSSVSHFSTSLSPDELMEPSFTGANHDVGLTLAVMRDIGWITNPAGSALPGTAASGGGGGGGGGGCFIGILTD
jgi:hypothetical protein